MTGVQTCALPISSGNSTKTHLMGTLKGYLKGGYAAMKYTWNAGYKIDPEKVLDGSYPMDKIDRQDAINAINMAKEAGQLLRKSGYENIFVKDSGMLTAAYFTGKAIQTNARMAFNTLFALGNILPGVFSQKYADKAKAEAYNSYIGYLGLEMLNKNVIITDEKGNKIKLGDTEGFGLGDMIRYSADKGSSQWHQGNRIEGAYNLGKAGIAWVAKTAIEVYLISKVLPGSGKVKSSRGVLKQMGLSGLGWGTANTIGAEFISRNIRNQPLTWTERGMIFGGTFLTAGLSKGFSLATSRMGYNSVRLAKIMGNRFTVITAGGVRAASLTLPVLNAASYAATGHIMSPEDNWQIGKLAFASGAFSGWMNTIAAPRMIRTLRSGSKTVINARAFGGNTLENLSRGAKAGVYLAQAGQIGANYANISLAINNLVGDGENYGIISGGAPLSFDANWRNMKGDFATGAAFGGVISGMGYAKNEGWMQNRLTTAIILSATGAGINIGRN